jgi:hypothetical protein
MQYATPEVKVVGAATDLVQSFAGPLTDWGATALSLGAVLDELEEE